MLIVIARRGQERLQAREIGHAREDLSAVGVRFFERKDAVARDVIPLVQASR